MSTTKTETLVDEPRGLVIVRYPPGFLKMLRKRAQQLRRALLLGTRTTTTRVDYGDVMHLLEDFLSQVKTIDKDTIPFDTLEGVIQRMENIEPNDRNSHRETLAELHQNMVSCFEACSLAPRTLGALKQQICTLQDQAPIPQEVSVVLRTCTDVTTESSTREELLRANDDIHFLIRRLTIAKPQSRNRNLYLQERKRHRWTRSGIEWRLLHRDEKLGDIPPTTDGRPLEIFFVDRPDHYVVATAGHDPQSPEPSREDLAVIIDMTTDVDKAVSECLTDLRFKYRRRRRSFNAWNGTPASTGMAPYDCDLHIITL